MARALVNKMITAGIRFPKVLGSYTAGIYKDSELKEVDGFEATLATLVRVQSDEGKWYLCPVIKSFIASGTTYKENERNYLNTMLDQAYASLLFTGVNSELVDTEGYPFFILDEDQRSEEDRMREIAKELF